MTILLDHCVPRLYARLLREWGYKVTLLQEHLSTDSDDIDVIGLALNLSAVLLTADNDFANILDYPPQDYGGIIVMRYEAEIENSVTATLKKALDELYPEKLKGALIIVTASHYRIRHE